MLPYITNICVILISSCIYFSVHAGCVSTEVSRVLWWWINKGIQQRRVSMIGEFGYMACPRRRKGWMAYVRIVGFEIKPVGKA
jgi:hypothetical protein